VEVCSGAEREMGKDEESREECLANFHRVSGNLLDGVLRPMLLH
jgi:hypothetical protein